MKLITIAVIIPFLLIPVFAQSDEDFIPEWVKANAGWWSEGKLSDSEYVEGLQWLIDNSVLHVENTKDIDVVEENTETHSTDLELYQAELITNYIKEIEDLTVKIDDVEYSKDVLEEELLNSKDEAQTFYEQEIENTTLELTEYYDDRINTIIDDTDADMKQQLDLHILLNEKFDSLWNEYVRLYGIISEVRENTNPSDFE